MSWWYIGLWTTYCLPLMWCASLGAPQLHEIIYVDFRRREIVRVA